MSYNIAICTGPIAIEDKAAWQELDAILTTKGEVPEVLRELYNRLTAKYPCICNPPDDEVDDGVWSDGPLLNNFSHRAAIIGFVSSRVAEALPFVICQANAHGLTVFDWTGPSIHPSSALSKSVGFGTDLESP